MKWLLLVSLLTIGIALYFRWKNGRFAAVHGESISATELGRPLGRRATYLQFSSEICSTCRATKRLLDDIAASTPGVDAIEIKVETHEALSDRFTVMRTPTVFVLGPSGEVLARDSGEMTRTQLMAALPPV